MVIMAEPEKYLQQNIIEYQKELEKINLEINIDKTKTMIMTVKEKCHKIELNGQGIKQVRSYNCLATSIEYNGKIDKEIPEIKRKVGRLYNSLKNSFFGKKEIPKERRVPVDGNIEKRFLRKIQVITRRDRIRNTIIVEELKIKPIEKVTKKKN
ncbi:hypothetical protein Zmor_007374 [Zophobas morio]|uniref:Uncharacterized protein n=1 Tax=Zophobas morio TaxID=2755281 RepID=A0AA38M4H3_9CUCU|nr:hypothetical protein Zmor_025275 [Zophobas morio]KAJ3663065.1 hypothetical protein Zmor_007374 [Zophobas morio]